MHFNIFSLQPNIFKSFFSNSLIARAIDKEIISYQLINWREKYGKSFHKQVDDKVFGGGSSMLLQADPIYKALQDLQAVSSLFKPPSKIETHRRILPNNSIFYKLWEKEPKKIKKVTISLTPRGFTFDQSVAIWLANNFEQISILCGRYEGFDARISEIVDLEISLGDFILNGGEVAAMSLVEVISRLLPGYLEKATSMEHDSFSQKLNFYPENQEFVVGKKNLPSLIPPKEARAQKLFSNSKWLKKLPFLEHPHYTREQIWKNWQVPEVLVSGDHKKVQKWREKGWKETV